MKKLNIDKTKAVCFTGHRPKSMHPQKPYDESTRLYYQDIVNRLVIRIKALVEQGYTTFITGGAQGFDQLAFWAVNNIKHGHPEVQNIVYQPFVGQERRWATTGLFSQQEYNTMLRYADQVYVCDENVDVTKYSEVARALLYRNQCMVNDSSYVIGQFADQSYLDPNVKGGTAACLKYATQVGTTIELFN